MEQWRNPRAMPQGARRTRGTGRFIDSLQTLFGSRHGPSRVAPSMLSNISEQSNISASKAGPAEVEELSSCGEPTRVISANTQRPSSAVGPAVSGISQKSTRTLLQSRKTATHPSSGKSRRTVARTEFENGIKLIRRNIFSRKPWRDGLLVMGIVVSNTLSSLALGWGIAFLYAMGSPFAPFFPTLVWEQQQVRSASKVVAFYGATGLYFVLFGCAAYLIPTAVLASKRITSFSDGRPTRPQGFRLALLRRLQGTWLALALTLVTGAAFMVFMALRKIQLRENARFHLYVMSAVVYGYSQFASFWMRSLRCARAREIRRSLMAPGSAIVPQNQPDASMPTAATIIARWSESVVSLKSPDTRLATLPSPPPPPPGGPTARQQQRQHRLHKAQRVFVHIVVFSAVFVYLHVASGLQLTKQWELMLFASASLVLKIAIQEVTKKFQLRCDATRKPSVRAVHLGMTIPTLAIDAQIRMVFLQNGGGQSIVASSIAIVFGEIFFRIAKIIKLRYSITKRLAECKGMQRIFKRVNSKLAARDVNTARAEFAEFLDWKSFVTRLHAAEVFADMHGEYISIGMSTAIVLFMGDGHPMFDLGSTSARSDAQATQRVLAALFQMGSGLVFDYISSVVESVHEVPLYESIADEGHSLRVFLHVLLSTLTAVNIGVISLFYLKSP